MAYNDTYNQNLRDDRIPQDLTRLEDLDDWQVAEGEPDPRGYDLIGRDGEKIGSIENLLASPSTQRAHFAIVDTGGWFSGKRFAIPLNCIQFDMDENRAYAPLTRVQFEQAPEYRDGSRAFDQYYTYWTSLGTADQSIDSAAPTTDEVRVPVTEETAEVRKERRRDGYVTLTKRAEVETQHISEPVTRTRVEVERRPVSGDAPYAQDPNTATLREGETLRVPVVEEEVVVEKVPRVTEEVVIRKDTDTEVVEKDVQLRHERVEVEEEGDVDAERSRGRR